MPVEINRTLAALDAMTRRIRAASAAAGRKAALAFQAEGMRDSPVLTGTLRRSWQTVTSQGLGVFSAMTGPTVIYARRIELGFKGADSLGRVYNQQPDPYVQPAYEQVLPTVRPLVVSELTRAIGA